MSAANDSRQRGYFLTRVGWLKLQAALHRWEVSSGNKATPRQLAVVAQLAGLPGPHHNTIRRILDQRVSVDVASLQLLFRAFALPLEQSDYTRSLPGECDAGPRQLSAAAGSLEDLLNNLNAQEQLEPLIHQLRQGGWLVVLDRCKTVRHSDRQLQAYSTLLRRLQEHPEGSTVVVLTRDRPL